jgi:hypothetical protein
MPREVRELIVTMQTFVMRDSILYTVIDGNPDAGDFGHSREVWRREIPLMQTEAYRAGGYSVTDAAREQERVAMQLAATLAADPAVR